MENHDGFRDTLSAPKSENLTAPTGGEIMAPGQRYGHHSGDRREGEPRLVMDTAVNERYASAGWRQFVARRQALSDVRCEERISCNAGRETDDDPDVDTRTVRSFAAIRRANRGQCDRDL